MSDSNKYTLRVPFQVQPGYAFGSTGPSSRTTFERLTVSLDQSQEGYTLRLDGFPSSQSASLFTPRVWTGLTILMLERGSAFSGSMDPRPVAYTEHMGKPSAGSLAQAFESQPGRLLEGVAHGDVPTVYPTDKNVAFLHMGSPEVRITIPAEQALTSVLKGFRSQTAPDLFADQRFHTAVDLYAAAFFEQSPAARLLTLSMVFEVLAPITYKHQAVQTLIDSWRASVEEARVANMADAAAVAALEALERELLFRRESSIRGRVRDFVFNELGGDAHADDQARRAVSAYDSRSKLLHDGRLDDVTRGRAVEAFNEVGKEILLRRIASPAA